MAPAKIETEYMNVVGLRADRGLLYMRRTRDPRTLGGIWRMWKLTPLGELVYYGITRGPDSEQDGGGA